MALFPIASNVEGDMAIMVVMVDDESTMDEVAKACAYHSVGRRVAPRPDKILRVRRSSTGEVYPRDMRLKEAGLLPTECVDLIFSDL